LEGNDRFQKHTSNRETAPFSRLMFGNRKLGDTYKESINNSQEKEQLSFDTRSSHKDDDWLFGRRRKEPVSVNQNRQKQTRNIQNKIENFINNVDIGLLMETFDTIGTTSKQFKPLITEIAPIVSKISKKFKK
jgi:hypothetical protein